MNSPGREVYRAIVESLCARLRIAAVLADADGRILWTNQFANEEFPGTFVANVRFEDAFQRSTRLELGRIDPSPLSPFFSGSELRRAESGAIYRHLRLPLEASGVNRSLHCLINVSHERQLEDLFLLNFHQLQSMKEIVDILYESLSTPEVVYLCLVAVTAQMGFGFNRALFLQVNGARARGRIGIGPSNADEAHQIWTRLASLNFSSLREVYQNLTKNAGIPDPGTHEVATQIDFDFRRYLDGGSLSPDLPGILGVLARGKPAKLNASDPGTEVDRLLFNLLSTDVVAVVPLFVRGSLAGVIIADNLITRKPITEADLNVLKTFAGYAGVALERSHLYDELRENVSKLQEANQSIQANQEKLLHAEKLSAIGQLAAYVSHEIRNPLVAIGGLAQSVLNDHEVDADRAESLQIIVSEVRRLEKFLRETLDFVKPLVVGTVSVDLNEIVRESLATFKNELAASSITVELGMLEEPVTCNIDPYLLRHALSNLLKNSIEAMRGGGRLYVGVESCGPAASIRVGDTGPGIPPEIRPRIFDPFFTTKPDGTGLGLSIASQNIRGLGGRLELEADRRFSTLFKLTLPAAARAEPHGWAAAGKEKDQKDSVAAYSRSLS